MSLRSWLRRAASIDEERWVVLDVEASGIDAARDRLLAIAALAVRPSAEGRPRIDFGDSFEVVLRQGETAVVDKSNILLHGIGVGAQRAGTDPALALAAFTAWVGHSPVIGFHSAFDQKMIRRALEAVAIGPLRNPWVDLAFVAEVARPDLRAKSLDEWLAPFGIEVAVRHQAAADALATAELMQQLWPAIASQKAAAGFRGLLELAEQRRWLRAT